MYHFRRVTLTATVTAVEIKWVKWLLQV